MLLKWLSGNIVAAYLIRHLTATASQKAVRLPPDTQTREGTAIAIDAFDNICVAGAAGHNVFPVNGDILIWKYLSDGSLDTSFNLDGIVVQSDVASSDGDEKAKGIALDGAGNVFVTGRSKNANNYDMFILNYK